MKVLMKIYATLESHYEHSMECNSLAESMSSRLCSLQIFSFSIRHIQRLRSLEDPLETFFMMRFQIRQIMFHLPKPVVYLTNADGKAACLSFLFPWEYFQSGLLPTVNGLRLMSVTHKK